MTPGRWWTARGRRLAGAGDDKEPDRGERVRRRRRWTWIVGGLIGALLAAAGTVAVTNPAGAAVACPACYGLQALAPGVYAEIGQTPAQRQQIVEILEAADRRVREFYHGRVSRPQMLVCRTERCYRRIGGGREKGRAISDWAFMLAPGGISEVTATHELAHVEFHRRLGSARSQVPQWFDEGLAVLISEDPRYLAPGRPGRPGPKGISDRCLITAGEASSVAHTTWIRRATGDDQAYAKAACLVSRWVAERGGRAAVLDLIRRLTAGERFDVIVKL
jgi:hypothetical protein